MSSIITVITNTLQYGLQLLIILFFKNYYLYIIVVLATQIFNNILTAIIVTRMYPKYKPVGRLEKKEIKKINGRIKDMFTGKIGSIILNSADTIVISSFLGLTTLAVYQNYYFIITSIIGFIEIIITSIMAGLGNSFITDTKEKVYTDLKKFTFMYQWLIGICSCYRICLLLPVNEWMAIFVRLIICMIIPNGIFLLVYHKKIEFGQSVQMLDKITKGKFHLGSLLKS